MTMSPVNLERDSSARRAQASHPLRAAIGELERLGRRARWLILWRRVFGLVAAALAVGAVIVGLDFVFRFPSFFRLILLLGGIVALISAGRRLLVPAWKFRPSLTELALRIERSSPALRGRLASGIEFALAGADGESALAARSVSDLSTRLDGESIRSWLAPRRSLAELSTAFVSVGVVSLAALLFPDHASIGVRRLIAPFSNVLWPARTAVVSLLEGKHHHAKGDPLVLAARLTDGDSASERIVASLTVTREDGERDELELVLTRQPDGRYERVLEGDARIARIDVRFLSADAETEPEAIEFVPAPAVTMSRLRLEPPSYAAGVIEAREVDLGDGTDERATLRDPALTGSIATLELTLNSPIRPADPEAWLARAMRIEAGQADESATLHIDPTDASRWTIGWTVRVPRELQIELEDDLGIRSSDEIRFRIEAVEDRPPTVGVTEPVVDESVLSTAVLSAAFEARDDVAIAQSGVVFARRIGGRGDPETTREHLQPSDGAVVRRSEPLDLVALGAEPGDTVTIVAVAEDGFALDGRRHERVTSPPRTLRIISEQELGKQVRGQLAAVRRSAMRVDQQQAEIAAATENGRFDPSLERGQAQVSERMRAAQEAINELSQRVRRNALPDAELAATLEQARDLIEVAGRASARASEAMQARREGDEAQRSEAESAVVAAQNEVREELEDLIKLLDRDEDSWAMGRQIDRLREEVKSLSRRTEEVGRRTVGQQAADVDPKDREELDRIASAQADAARSAQELVDELRKRAESVERNDKPRADAMREAAKAAEERRLERNLEQAGRDVRENRMQQAQAAQQSAAEALEAMQRGLDDVKKARTEELRRALESLERSIERLVAQSEHELIALDRIDGPEAEESISERGRAMAKLAQNTQAVASEARSAGSDTSRIARVLDRAADSQGGAVGFLRARPPRLTDARAAEERGLTLLREALDATKATREAVEQRELERKRREIGAAYRRLIEKQASVMEGTVATRPSTPTGRLDRRALIESRRLAITQGEIGSAMRSMQEEHPELETSEVVAETHALVGRWSSEASERLGAGDLSDGTLELERFVIEAIGSIVASLEPEEDDDPFQEDGADGQQGGGNAGGQQNQPDDPLIPSLAELKLLRGLQVQLLQRTKRSDALRDGAEGIREGAAEEIKQLSETQHRITGAAERLIKRLERPKLPEASERGAPGNAVPEPAPQSSPESVPEPAPQPTSESLSVGMGSGSALSKRAPKRRGDRARSAGESGSRNLRRDDTIDKSFLTRAFTALRGAR